MTEEKKGSLKWYLRRKNENILTLHKHHFIHFCEEDFVLLHIDIASLIICKQAISNLKA